MFSTANCLVPTPGLQNARLCKMKKKLVCFALLRFFGFLCPRGRGAPSVQSLFVGEVDAAQLKEARISQVIKDVKLLPAQAAPRPAAVRDEVRDGTAVRTGVDSRAELTFTDQTLARLGANTIFSFREGTRNLELSGGAMLLRVPKDAGGAQINTAAVTAAITGTTIMLEYHPNAYIKFIVLEGTGRMFRKDHIGESVLIHAGPDADRESERDAFAGSRGCGFEATDENIPPDQEFRAAPEQ